MVLQAFEFDVLYLLIVLLFGGAKLVQNLLPHWCIKPCLIKQRCFRDKTSLIKTTFTNSKKYINKKKELEIKCNLCLNFLA